MNPAFSKVVQHFGENGAHALVIGDVMLDRYLMGEVNRISPEAPVPVVLIKSEQQRVGGAANVAANLALLGIPTKMIGLMGDDNEGETLLKAMQAHGISTDAMLSSPHRPTIAKTRILGGHQQMLRLDQEDTQSLSETEQSDILDKIEAALAAHPSLVILSDYAKGLLTETVCQQVI